MMMLCCGRCWSGFCRSQNDFRRPTLQKLCQKLLKIWLFNYLLTCNPVVYVVDWGSSCNC